MAQRAYRFIATGASEDSRSRRDIRPFGDLRDPRIMASQLKNRRDGFL